MSKSKKPKRQPRARATKPEPAKIDPDRAEAARDVLEHVFLAEKNFDLEALITETVEEDAAGHVWVTVKLHVPALDVDMWLDGTHIDHPDNTDENK